MNEVLRQEKKFLISLDKYYQLSHLIGQVVHEDSHNLGEGYPIRSLYYDTIDEKDYMEKEDGVEIRRKIRLRNYGADSQFAILEMKQKQGMMQKKRSLRMTKEDAIQLIQRNYGVLLNYKEPFAAECYGLMNMLCYVPRAVVEYKRKAFIAKENSIRITFDHHIIATESNYDIFSPQLLEYSVMNPYLVVLEVKFNGFLLSYLKELFERANIEELAVSKYCLAREVSMHYRF